MKKLTCFTFSLFFFVGAYSQKNITVVYKQQAQVTTETLKSDDNNSDQMPPGLPDMMADMLSKSLTFTRTFRSSHDTNYISIIHTPETVANITVTMDFPPHHEIFYRNKFYRLENGKYIEDTVFNNRPKMHLEATGLKAKILNYDCDIFNTENRKNTFYITKDLHQNINPLFRQFDNLDGAILYAKIYSEEDKGYLIFTATSVK